MQAVLGSGIRFMSDSLIAFQPAIEEPSNICPSAKVSSSINETSKVTCCHLPRGSVKRKSTSLTVVMACVPFSRAGTVYEHSVDEHPVANTWRQRGAGESCATSG